MINVFIPMLCFNCVSINSFAHLIDSFIWFASNFWHTFKKRMNEKPTAEIFSIFSSVASLAGWRFNAATAFRDFDSDFASCATACWCCCCCWCGKSRVAYGLTKFDKLITKYGTSNTLTEAWGLGSQAHMQANNRIHMYFASFSTT